jgi:hypothetical protein
MTYFKVALFLLSSLGYVKYIAEKLKLGFGAAPFVYCSFVAVLLCLFGIVDQLIWGTWVATTIGVGLLIYGFASSPKRFFDFARPLVFALVVLLTVCWFYQAIDEHFRFLLWDEFSFWAASTRLIYTTDSLFKENSPIFFKSYPPIQQLFQYYVLQFFSWSEKNALFAQDIWLLSGALCIASLPKAGAFTKIGLFFSVVTLVYAFGYSFSSLYSDALLGMCFVAALSLAVKEAQRLAVWFALAISLSVLILLKEIGILLALVVIFVYAANMYWATPVPGQTLSHGFMRVLNGLTANALKIFSLVAVIIAVMKSWAWYVKSIEATRAIAFPSLDQWSEGPFQKRLLTTLGEFLRRMVETDYVSLSIPFSQWHPTILMIVVVLSLGSVLVVYRAQTNQRVLCGVTMGVLFLGFWGYTAALVLSYLIIFTEYEGIRLASFERYLSTYLLAWASFVFVKLFESSDRSSRNIPTQFAALCLVVLTLTTNGQFLKELGGIKAVGAAYQLRTEIEAFAEKMKSQIEPHQKIYFIAQNSNGIERVMFYYAMLPSTVSMSWCWSLGDKYFEGDVWTCNQTLNGLVGDYDYLALYRGDDQFWAKNQSFFDRASVGGTQGLYKINRQNGQVQLTRVGAQ